MRCVIAEEIAKRFKEGLYPDGGVPFCRFCEHSVDFVRVDTIKDHLKSIKHVSNKESKTSEEGTSSGACRSGRQVTLSTVLNPRSPSRFRSGLCQTVHYCRHSDRKDEAISQEVLCTGWSFASN